MRQEFEVKFWGVRGSYPVPGANTMEYGGNSACVEVRANGHLIILDAGSGIINLGQSLLKERGDSVPHQPIVATILLTHTHHDHTQGFPFFAPAYKGSSVLYMFGPRMFDEDLEEALSKAMIPPFFPVVLKDLNALKIIRNIREFEEVHLKPATAEPEIRHRGWGQESKVEGEVIINSLRSRAHPSDGVVIYRIEANGKSLVYATDTEGYVGGSTRLIELARGCDLLIHDAQYTTAEYTDAKDPRQGYGHSTPEMAIEVAREAGIKQLVLFHHDPTHDDRQLEQMEAEARKLFPNCTSAREGMSLSL